MLNLPQWKEHRIGLIRLHNVIIEEYGKLLVVIWENFNDDESVNMVYEIYYLESELGLGTSEFSKIGEIIVPNRKFYILNSIFN